MKRNAFKLFAASMLASALCACVHVAPSEGAAEEPVVKIGWGRRSINPGEPVAITGQHYLRVSLGEYNPVLAEALVLENGKDAAIFVSVDMVGLRGRILERVHWDALFGINGQKLRSHFRHDGIEQPFRHPVRVFVLVQADVPNRGYRRAPDR